jgi:putative DNA primase/helicase
MLTTPEISGRLLGQSKTVSVNTATTLCYTGNNLQIVGDLVPRTLLCRIDAATEHPDQRQFGIDLDEYIPQQRGALVSAALTVILAYVGAGSPAIPGAPLLSRFSLWDGMVRRPLLWLGMADPLATRATMEAADSRRELHRSIMEAWHDRFGDEAVTVKDLIAAAEPLSEHLAALALRGSNAPSKRSLGRYFARHENVIEAGLRIERGGKDTTANVETWRCIRVVERPADEG